MGIELSNEARRAAVALALVYAQYQDARREWLGGCRVRGARVMAVFGPMLIDRQNAIGAALVSPDRVRRAVLEAERYLTRGKDD